MQQSQATSAPKQAGVSESADTSSPAVSSIEILQTEWAGLIRTLPLEVTGATAVLHDLLNRHNEPGRAYHNCDHLASMLAFLDTHSSALTNQTAVTLAVFFHDSIYDSKAKDNEEKSADLAQVALEGLGVDSVLISQVKTLILSTKKHQPLLPGTDNKLFLDADLSVLGRPPAQYFKYADAIRTEYSWVPDREYASGRSAVLKAFLDRERLFFQPETYALLESQARLNMQAEIIQLTTRLR